MRVVYRRGRGGGHYWCQGLFLEYLDLERGLVTSDGCNCLLEGLQGRGGGVGGGNHFVNTSYWTF